MVWFHVGWCARFSFIRTQITYSMVVIIWAYYLGRFSPCLLLPLALTFCATSLLCTYILQISSWYWYFGSGFATWWNIDGLARSVDAWLHLQWLKVVSLPPPPTRRLPTSTARSPPGWRTACRPTPHAPRRQRTSGRAAESIKGESPRF